MANWTQEERDEAVERLRKRLEKHPKIVTVCAHHGNTTCRDMYEIYTFDADENGVPGLVWSTRLVAKALGRSYIDTTGGGMVMLGTGYCKYQTIAEELSSKLGMKITVQHLGRA